YEIDNTLPAVQDLDDFLQKKASMIAKELIFAKKALIISGVHSFSTSIIKSSFNIAKAIQKNSNNHVGLNFMTYSSNSLGVGLMGGMSLNCALKNFKENKFDAIIFMEYDLYRYVNKSDFDAILKDKVNIITLDHQYTPTYNNSGLSFSSTSIVESTGTVINFEGRAQRFFQVYDPYFYNDDICLIHSWKWLHKIYTKINKIKNALRKNHLYSVCEEA
ncbi:MAG: NADH-quinone oxidoreductase subunit G, partial [Buchnera aphidicola]|nr:NADH-quinone oxidoreductase subunit G [Buchnera aphidicola]